MPGAVFLQQLRLVAGGPDPFPGGQIIDFCVGPEFFEQPERLWIPGPPVFFGVRLGQFIDLMRRIVEISKKNGPCRAGLGACRPVLILFQVATPFGMCFFHGQLVPMKAEAAFLDDTPHADRNAGA